MRTQDGIVARINLRKEDDLLGFETEVYYTFLDPAHVRPVLRERTNHEGWEEGREKRTPAECIRDYMPFAWDKANDCRGISANRSIGHFIAWVWLDGDDTGWLEKDYEKNYKYYGKPQLVKICEKYGINWRELDDDQWTNNEDGRGSTADKVLGLKS